MYNFTVSGQRGTLFWHAHISWIRATVHGPLIILPKPNVPYPFGNPYKEVPIIFGNQPLTIVHLWSTSLSWVDSFHKTLVLRTIAGEWWNVDPEAVISQALQTGAGPNVSDAYTINGLPGPLYNCSAKGMVVLYFLGISTCNYLYCRC